MAAAAAEGAETPMEAAEEAAATEAAEVATAEEEVAKVATEARVAMAGRLAALAAACPTRGITTPAGHDSKPARLSAG